MTGQVCGKSLEGEGRRERQRGREREREHWPCPRVAGGEIRCYWLPLTKLAFKHKVLDIARL